MLQVKEGLDDPDGWGGCTVYTPHVDSFDVCLLNISYLISKYWG